MKNMKNGNHRANETAGEIIPAHDDGDALSSRNHAASPLKESHGKTGKENHGKAPKENHDNHTAARSVMFSAAREKLPVLLSIKAEQDFDGMDPDQTELLTEGVMELTPDGMALSYHESALTGMEGTLTEFEVRGPRVILRRTGSVSSQMVFEEGRQHTSLYETPFGELSIDVQTSYLRHSLSERGGLMEIRYSISVEHAATGKNRFQLQVKRKNQLPPANQDSAI